MSPWCNFLRKIELWRNFLRKIEWAATYEMDILARLLPREVILWHVLPRLPHKRLGDLTDDDVHALAQADDPDALDRLGCTPRIVSNVQYWLGLSLSAIGRSCVALQVLREQFYLICADVCVNEQYFSADEMLIIQELHVINDINSRNVHRHGPDDTRTMYSLDTMYSKRGEVLTRILDLGLDGTLRRLVGKFLLAVHRMSMYYYSPFGTLFRAIWSGCHNPWGNLRLLRDSNVSMLAELMDLRHYQRVRWAKRHGRIGDHRLRRALYTHHRMLVEQDCHGIDALYFTPREARVMRMLSRLRLYGARTILRTDRHTTMRLLRLFRMAGRTLHVYPFSKFETSFLSSNEHHHSTRVCRPTGCL